MERTRKRASNARSLRAPNELKKSKPGDSSLTEIAASCGGISSNKDHLFKTEHEPISIEEHGRTEPLDSSWGSTMESSSLDDDQSTVLKVEEDLVEQDVMTEQNQSPREAGHQTTPTEDQPKKSESTKQTPDHQTKLYTCACGKSYTSNSHLHRHQKSHGGDKRSSGQSVGEPSEGKVTNEKSFLCICGKSYTISSHLYRHQKTCPAIITTNVESDVEDSKFKPYTCACGKHYTCSSHLYRHQKTHLDGNKESAKRHICHCGKMFCKKSNLSRHQKTHTKETFKLEEHGGDSVEATKTEAPGLMKLYMCQCGKSYTSISHLYQHQKSHLPGNKERAKTHKCECGKVFCKKSNLSRHQKTHTKETFKIEEHGGDSVEDTKTESPEKMKLYECHCGKNYTSTSHLYRHQKSHLAGNEESAKTHICDCGKVFCSKSNLGRHQKTHMQETFQMEEHEGDSVEDTETEAPENSKPYVCHCGKSYTSTSHLYRHQRTHQVDNVSASSSDQAEENKMEKPHKCECGKSYTCTSHLYRHLRTHKTQELLVDDLDCDSDFQMDDLRTKPYQCECGKTFILWFSLMVHKRIHCKAKLQSPSA